MITSSLGSFVSLESINMKHKEKEYLIAFKLYIDHYDSRYRYPKWIRAINKKDAITKYIKIIKPDVALGACIIMDERPVKQDETKEAVKEVNLEKINDAYRKGNLKLLEMMISQLSKTIDPSNPNHTPRPDIIDMVAINEELYSTSRLVGIPRHMLPSNEYIYTDDFFEYVRDYITDRYNYEFYNDYTLMKIRDELQCMYDNYSKHGILPWETKKDEDAVCGTSEVMKVSDAPAVVNREGAEGDKIPAIKITKQRTDEEEVTMKENIIKGDRTNEKTPIDIIEYAPQFDMACVDISPNFPYILEIDNINTGISEKHVIVITQIMANCIYCNYWSNIYCQNEDDFKDNPHSGMVLTALDFHERNGKLYKITGEDLK